MLIESIKLHNFRQFRDASINFAQGENGKNVTIIIGENGTGKTTFAQAFFWCMYGTTEFSDKNLLNRVIATEMTPEQDETVSVTLVLKHGDVRYKLTRTQTYHKTYSNSVRGDNTVLTVAKKDVGGNTVYVKNPLARESEVNNILPKELSRYFFFDGERIERMSKDISSGKKSADFAEAVKGLLGLNSFISALSHLNPKSRYGVIGSYASSFDSGSNKKIAEYTEIIEDCNSKIQGHESTIEECENQINIARQRKSEKTAELKTYADGEKLQKQKEDLGKKIKIVERSQSNMRKAISKEFNSAMSAFFSASLIEKALSSLVEEDIIGKDIPFMHAKTIEYLINQGVCICGTHLDEGSIAYNKVKELANYLPPQSISTTVSEFKQEAKKRIGTLKEGDVVSQVQDFLAALSEQNDEITEMKDHIREIDKKLLGDDVSAKVRTITSEIRICDDTIRKNDDTKSKCYREIGGLEAERDRADTERRQLALLDARNRKIEIYKIYAERIYQELSEVYKENEVRIREKLQNTINSIFKEIYAGGLSLTIDEKYHISVYADQYDGDVETSTAQSISVIFAFITSIIKMACENRSASGDDANLLSSEPYPLVMDAPLSTLDRRRIESVCKALPSIAEQVVIFIKDIDGELAEQYIGDRIGGRYKLDKLNEFETLLA